MLCDLFQTVPLTCCVLKNGDWKNPQPKNETMCYGQAVQSNSTSEEYVHHKVRTLCLYLAEVLLDEFYGMKTAQVTLLRRTLMSSA